jgi:hypothetical protein
MAEQNVWEDQKMTERQHVSFPEPRWERDWRAHEEQHMQRPKTPVEQAVSHVDDLTLRLPSVVKEYFVTEHMSRKPTLTPEERSQMKQDNLTRLEHILQDEELHGQFTQFESALTKLALERSKKYGAEQTVFLK